jgi:hypothetical protein
VPGLQDSVFAVSRLDGCAQDRILKTWPSGFLLSSDTSLQVPTNGLCPILPSGSAMPEAEDTLGQSCAVRRLTPSLLA